METPDLGDDESERANVKHPRLAAGDKTETRWKTDEKNREREISSIPMFLQ